MNNAKLTRRGFATTAATGLAALGLLGATVRSASAYQGNMEHALGSLQAALQELQASTPNKGGHRERAIEMVRQAMAESGAVRGPGPQGTEGRCPRWSASRLRAALRA